MRCRTLPHCGSCGVNSRVRLLRIQSLRFWIPLRECLCFPFFVTVFFNMTLLTVYSRLTGNGERERRGVTCSKGRPDQESNRRCHGNHAYVAVPMWYAPWPVGHQTPRDCVIESALEKVEKPEIAPTIWVDGSKLWDDNLGLFRPTLRPNLDRMLTTTEEPP